MSIKHKIAKGAVALALTGASVLGVAGSADASSGAAWLGYGHTTSGSGVWCVQHNLNYMIDSHAWADDYPDPPYGKIAEDSVWGRRTDATVRWLQGWLTFETPDGVVGPNTGSVLISNGDPKYVGTWNTGHGYCWDRLPGDYL
ncbi:hypothetical protein [Streptomyces collinus]|uniref:hypothetical protein n=1 Tax=Streptomyces collinus TaxID=42684 RepID=UPI003692E7B7